jgi:hypothetical protein
MPRSISAFMLERSIKRAAERGPVPTPAEWVNTQPPQWRPMCAVFAVNINTPGGIVGKTVDDMIATAGKAGVKMSRRTFFRKWDVMKDFGVVVQEKNWHPDSEPGNPRRAPSTWIINLREQVPDVPNVFEPDESDIAAWLASTGTAAAVDEMRARLAMQSPQPPF